MARTRFGSTPGRCSKRRYRRRDETYQNWQGRPGSRTGPQSSHLILCWIYDNGFKVWVYGVHENTHYPHHNFPCPEVGAKHPGPGAYNFGFKVNRFNIMVCDQHHNPPCPGLEQYSRGRILIIWILVLKILHDRTCLYFWHRHRGL